MPRTLSTFFLALTAALGLFPDTGVASLLPAESMMESLGGGMGASKSAQSTTFLEELSYPVPYNRMSSDDGSASGMRTTSASSPSSSSPCTLCDCVELRLVSLATYQICETRAILVVPFLDGIFRPPKR